MQKILLVINADKPQVPCLGFATYIASLSHSILVGIFVKQSGNQIAPFDNNIVETAKVKEIASERLQTEAGENHLQQSIQLFKEKCSERQVISDVHTDRGIAINEVVLESRYADYLIVDAAISFDKNQQDTRPSSFLKLLLRDSECPVMIAPDHFEGIDEIVHTYDGSKTSMFAIRQFTCLFPELTEKKITLMDIKTGNDDHYIKKMNKLKEFMKCHYSGVHYEILQGLNPKEALTSQFMGTPKKLLVMGAYGKQKWFGNHTADLILEMVDQPIFITHQ